MPSPLPTLVMVCKMASRSAGGGKPTKRVLSRRPGRRIAGSMISKEGDIVLHTENMVFKKHVINMRDGEGLFFKRKS